MPLPKFEPSIEAGLESVNPASEMLKAAWVAYDKAMRVWIHTHDNSSPPKPPRISRPNSN